MNDQNKAELRRLAEAATPGRNYDRLDSAGGRIKYTCTGDDGSLVLRVDHKNEEFGFVGPNGEADEAFFLAATPAAILSLMFESEVLIKQVAALQSDENSWQSGYDKGREMGAKHRSAEVYQLRAEVEALRGLLSEAYPHACWRRDSLDLDKPDDISRAYAMQELIDRIEAVIAKEGSANG